MKLHDSQTMMGRGGGKNGFYLLRKLHDSQTDSTISIHSLMVLLTKEIT